MNAGGGRKAVFLDRDGVLNRERGEHTWRLPDFEVLPGVPEVLADLQRRGWLLIVVSNQSGIGLGLYGHAEVEVLHRYLHDRLAEQGAVLDAVYYCPHHPTKGRCLCRKPGSLLLEKAIGRFGIDPARSYFIGDRERDAEAARAAGVRPVLIPSNALLKEVVDQTVLQA
jgi:D-glycero-D-manno-heptose 1,7-bisphosphate phosphatase